MGNRSGKFAALALLTTGATFGGAAVASAQVYPPTSCGLAVDAVVAVPGESVVAATAGCDDAFAAGAIVTFTLQLGQDDAPGGTGGGDGDGNGGGAPAETDGQGGNGGGGSPEPSGRVVGSATADADGNISAPIPIPAEASAGAYTVVASGAGADGSTVTLTANLTAAVAGSATDASASAEGSRRSGGSVEPASAAEELLPSGGFTPLWLVAPAFVLLTLSTAGVLALRRRAIVSARG